MQPSSQPSGFFLIEFSALQAGLGGVVAIDGTRVTGGNGPHLFSGTLDFSGEQVTATMRVKPVSNFAESVFGTVGYAFDLTLSGTVSADGFLLTGKSPIPSGPPVSVKGTKIAELDLQ